MIVVEQQQEELVTTEIGVVVDFILTTIFHISIALEFLSIIRSSVRSARVLIKVI